MAEEQSLPAIAHRLQRLMLEEYEAKFEKGEINSSDLANLEKLLARNGYNFDPKLIPQGLQDKLPDPVSFDEDDRGDVKILPMQRKQA